MLPREIPQGEMILRIKEWRLLGFDVGRYKHHIVVGSRRPLKRRKVDVGRHPWENKEVFTWKWYPDWQVRAIYILEGKFGWKRNMLNNTLRYNLVLNIEKQGPEGWRLGVPT